jgi:hypothetical protein
LPSIEKNTDYSNKLQNILDDIYIKILIKIIKIKENLIFEIINLYEIKVYYIITEKKFIRFLK